MTSKPIVLVNIARPQDPKIAHLSLLFVGGALRRAGYDVKVFFFNSDDMDGYVDKVLKLDPLFIGLSAITGHKTWASAIFSQKIKEKSDVPIVWGGVHPSLVPKQTLSEKYIDYIVVGEGEETVVELTEAILGKKRLKDVRGIGYKINEELKFTEPRPLIEKLDECVPDWELIDPTKYFDKMWDCEKILNLQTSRGCVFNCKFCYNNTFNCGRWRGRSVDSVLKEINHLKDTYGMDGIIFCDDYLFANPKRAIEIVEKANMPWFGEIRIDAINRDVVRKLSETKAKWIMMGLESGSDRILKKVNKGFTTDFVKEKIKVLSEYKDLRVSASFIMGLPGETQEDLFKTIDLILDLIKIHPEMRYNFGVYCPYPGSEVYEWAVEKGFQVPKTTEEWGRLNKDTENMRLVWVDWQKNPQYYQQIKAYAHLLPLRMYKIPYFSQLPIKRLRERDFNHPGEIKMLTSLQKRFAKKGHPLRKFGYKVLPILKRS